MTPLFQLDWMGGWSERRLRRRRPGIDDLPWGTVAADTSLGDDDRLEARRVWTTGVFTEYASAAAFSNLTTALLECGAPVDLTAVAADIVVDELDHVELVARLLDELGGALPLPFDVAAISQAPRGDTPLDRALELAITVSCVGEALSVPALARSRALTTQPLVRAVLDRLLGDEGPHGELGYRLLDWAMPVLDGDDRARLGTIALTAIAGFAPLWQEPACASCAAPALGVAPAPEHRALLVAAVEDRVVARLAHHGVVVDGDALRAVLATTA